MLLFLWEELNSELLRHLLSHFPCLTGPSSPFGEEMYVNPDNSAACVAVIHLVVAEPGEPGLTWLIASVFHISSASRAPGPHHRLFNSNHFKASSLYHRHKKIDGRRLRERERIEQNKSPD